MGDSRAQVPMALYPSFTPYQGTESKKIHHFFSISRVFFIRFEIFKMIRFDPILVAAFGQAQRQGALNTFGQLTLPVNGTLRGKQGQELI